MKSTMVPVILIGWLSLSGCKAMMNLEGDFLAGSGFSGYEKLAQTKVSGESCRYMLGIVPLSSGTATRAGIEAIQKGPTGTRGLNDVEITSRENLFYPVPILFWSHCVTVKGYPARRSRP